MLGRDPRSAESDFTRAAAADQNFLEGRKRASTALAWWHRGCPVSVTLEQHFTDGRPSRPEQFRWLHGCGQRGGWTSRARAKGAGTSHIARCNATPIIPGFDYQIHSLAGEFFVVLQGGERFNATNPGNWLLRANGEEGPQKLKEAIVAAGGRVAWDWSTSTHPSRLLPPDSRRVVPEPFRCAETTKYGQPCPHWANHRRTMDGALVCGIHVGSGATRLNEDELRALENA